MNYSNTTWEFCYHFFSVQNYFVWRFLEWNDWHKDWVLYNYLLCHFCLCLELALHIFSIVVKYCIHRHCYPNLVKCVLTVIIWQLYVLTVIVYTPILLYSSPILLSKHFDKNVHKNVFLHRNVFPSAIHNAEVLSIDVVWLPTKSCLNKWLMFINGLMIIPTLILFLISMDYA